MHKHALGCLHCKRQHQLLSIFQGLINSLFVTEQANYFNILIISQSLADIHTFQSTVGCVSCCEVLL